MSNSLNYEVTDNWQSGFVGSIAITAGETGLAGWQLQFQAGFEITNIWNAEIVSHVGDTYILRNAPWNGTVAAGQAVTFGFQATPVTGGIWPSHFVLNGQPVGGVGAVPPTLAVADASLLEGDAGESGRMIFRVQLSEAADAPVTVRFRTLDGTALAGEDYVARSGKLTFAAGETVKNVAITVLGDDLVEGNEAFRFRLLQPTGATLDDPVGVGRILDDDAPPTLRVFDASVVEGDPGERSALLFRVRLSGPSDEAVTVNYRTVEGTASAGQDFISRSGSLTFEPGQVAKAIKVWVKGDSLVEGTEHLSFRLSAPSGATIADGRGEGTILDDDGLAAAGWFATSGNQIVDSGGQAVKIAGVNWFGLESGNFAPHGLWTRGYKEMMDQMADLGFNTIRLPFSSELLHTTAAPNGIDFSKNPDLAGLSGLQIMDRIVDYAGEIGLRIILDHHRSEAGAGASGNGLWYNGQYSEAAWIQDWRMLAARYGDDPTVIGADLHNEPWNGTWGGGGANDWAAAAERAGNAIGTVNANWLVFVEGVGSYQGDAYWWGGNLQGVRDRPIELDLPNRLVYSAHDYPNSVYPQPWFQQPDFAENLPGIFDEYWGYIFREGIAPVYVGEFGTRLVDPKDAPWFEAITSYLGGDFDNDGDSDLAPGEQGLSWTYWSWNPNSGDTGGILQDDWRSVHLNKLAYLEPLLSPFQDALLA